MLARQSMDLYPLPNMQDLSKSFFPLWDTTEKVFLRCRIQQKRIFPLWNTLENNLRMANKFCSIVSHNAGKFSSVVSYTSTESCAVYCIPEKSSALYPTIPQVFFHCIPQWKIFSSIVGYNGRGFYSLWDTTEEAVLHCEIQQKRFFPLWDTTEGVFSIVGYNEKITYNAE
jgi:hypothetical protein